MLELIFRIIIAVTVMLAVLSGLYLIPEFAALLALATNSAGEITNAIDAFTAILKQYVQPFLGLLNNILPASVKLALISLIVWRITKPYALWFLRWTAGAAQKIISMASK